MLPAVVFTGLAIVTLPPIVPKPFGNLAKYIILLLSLVTVILEVPLPNCQIALGAPILLKSKVPALVILPKKLNGLLPALLAVKLPALPIFKTPKVLVSIVPAGTTTVNGTFTDTVGGGVNTFGVLNIGGTGSFLVGNGSGDSYKFFGSITNAGVFDLAATTTSTNWVLGDLLSSTPITVTNNSVNTMFFSRGNSGTGRIEGDVTINDSATGGNIELNGNGFNPAGGAGNIFILSTKTLTNQLGMSSLTLANKRLIASPRDGVGGNFVNSGIVQINGNGTAEPAYDFTTSPNLVIFNNNANVIATTYRDIAFIGVSNTLTGTTTINGNLTINTGTLNTNNFNIDIKGSWSNSGTFTAGIGTETVTFSGTTQQNINQATTFHNLTINNTTDRRAHV